jgi:hypothetical protein
MGTNEVAAGWKMMTSCYAVPAAGSLHVGEAQAHVPPFTFPQDDELGRGPGKNSDLLGANDG